MSRRRPLGAKVFRRSSPQLKSSSDANQNTLYVLTRDIERFETLYEQEVLDKVEAYGFTGYFNEPIKNDQEGC